MSSPTTTVTVVVADTAVAGSTINMILTVSTTTAVSTTTVATTTVSATAVSTTLSTTTLSATTGSSTTVSTTTVSTTVSTTTVCTTLSTISYYSIYYYSYEQYNYSKYYCSKSTTLQCLLQYLLQLNRSDGVSKLSLSGSRTSPCVSNNSACSVHYPGKRYKILQCCYLAVYCFGLSFF